MADNEEELLAGTDDGAQATTQFDEDTLLGNKDNGETNPFEVKQEEPDLFDAAIEPSNGGGEKDTSMVSTGSNSTAPTTPVVSSSSSNAALAAIANATGRKFCCYIGNMTWWTTDEDLQKAITSVGANDLIDLKFYENRTNGQSKGFCLAVFLSDQSVRTITEKLPLRPVHGQTLVVLPYSKVSLTRLEEASAKTQSRADQKKPKVEENNMLNMGTIRISANGVAPIGGAAAGMMVGGPNMMGAGPMNQMMGRPMGAPMGNPMMGPRGGVQLIMQPQQMGGPAMNMQMMGGPQMTGGVRPQMGMSQPPPGMGAPPPVAGAQPQPLMSRPVGAPGQFPAGAHINPNVYPGFQPSGTGDSGAPLSEPEIEEIMTRNRTISSSAISRAIADATSGDHANAIDTLLTAISLIKQSRVAGDERCRLLISSLHDTLSGIEAKMKERKRERRDRSRSRSRERKHRRRSRSRSRSPRRGKY